MDPQVEAIQLYSHLLLFLVVPVLFLVLCNDDNVAVMRTRRVVDPIFS